MLVLVQPQFLRGVYITPLNQPPHPITGVALTVALLVGAILPLHCNNQVMCYSLRSNHHQH